MSDCIFCKLASEDSKKKLYENDNFFAILDIDQSIKGHVLIISKKHFENSLDLPVSLGGELLDAIKKVATKMIEEDKAEGFNLFGNNFSVSGQVVNHFHVHIIPRREGDGFKFL